MRCGGRGRQPPPALWKTKRLAPLGLRRRTCSACSRAHKGHVPCVRHSSPRRTANKKRTAKMTVRSTLILASGMAKPNGPVHNVSDLACRSRHHSDPLAGLLTPFRRRVLWLFPARRPFVQLSIGSITQKSPNCKEIPAPPPRFSCAVLPPGYSAVRTRRNAPRPAIFFSRQVRLVGDFLVVRGLPGDARHFLGLYFILRIFLPAFPVFQPPSLPPLGSASAASRPYGSGTPTRRCGRAAES